MHAVHVHEADGHAAVGMREHRPLHCTLIHEIQRPAGQVIQAVQVAFFFAHQHLRAGIVHRDHRLHEDALAFLNELAHRMQVGRQIDGCREDAFPVLALALAVELLPPFADVVQAGLVVGQDLDLLAPAV